MQEKRNNWIQIIITALITGIVTVTAGMVLYNLQTNKPELSYYAPDTIPFQGTGKNFAIYNIVVSNSGGTNIENVIGVIQIPDSSIEDKKVTAPSTLKYSFDISNDALTIEFPDLNPTDTITISILASSQTEMDSNPIISFRGKGVSGIESASINNSILNHNEPSSILVVIIAFFAGLISIFSSIIGTRISSISIAGITIPIPGGGNSILFGKHSEDQNKVLAYLCGLHGLVDDVELYLSRENQTNYWSEADRFGALATNNSTSEDTAKRKKVLIDLLKYANMAGQSKAIIHYNIARIALAQNNEDETIEHLGLAKRNGGKLIVLRLEMEPNLQSLLKQ